MRWFETKERNEEEKEKKELRESERETKCEFLCYLLESFFTFEYIFYTLLLNDYLFTPPNEPSEKAPFWFVNKTRYHKIQKKIFRVYKIPTRPRRPPCLRSLWPHCTSRTKFLRSERRTRKSARTKEQSVARAHTYIYIFFFARIGRRFNYTKIRWCAGSTARW